MKKNTPNALSFYNKFEYFQNEYVRHTMHGVYKYKHAAPDDRVHPRNNIESIKTIQNFKNIQMEIPSFAYSITYCM